MASIVNDPNGRKRISFQGPDGRRHSIRLGVMGDNVAEDFRDKISHLVSCLSAPHLISDNVIRWAGGLPDLTFDRIARTGLLPPRKNAVRSVVTLRAFLDDVFATLQVKESTRVFYGHTRRCLLDHFGEERDLTTITAKDADAFHSWLARNKFGNRQLAAATVARRLLLTRHTFGKAIRWGYIQANPFAGIRVGRQINPSRKVYVAREIVAAVIAATADPQLRLMLALSRYAGLRCPSEHLALRWGDIDWEGGRMTVTSPKTEGHQGGEGRVIPLFGDVQPYLLHVRDDAEDGAEFVITRWRSSAVNLRTGLLRIIRRAGLKAWPKLWHNLRASCETDLARQYPLGTVAEWLGHNPAIMVTNYLMNPDLDADFKRAGTAVKNATRNPTRLSVENDGKQCGETGVEVAKTPENAIFIAVSDEGGMGRVGPEHHIKTSKTDAFLKSDAQSGAHPTHSHLRRTSPGAACAPIPASFLLAPPPPLPDVDLEHLLAVWPTLPLEVRAAIMILATQEGRK